MKKTVSNELESVKQQEIRKKFLDSQNTERRVRKNIFDNYKMINNYELRLPNTDNKLIYSLWQNKRDDDDFLLKQQIGKTTMFWDAKISFIASEVIRFLTADIVPDEMKPDSDKKGKDDK